MTSTDLQAWYYRGEACAATPDPWQALDDAIFRVRSLHGASGHECAPSCTACCRFPVGVSELEVRHLAALLRTQLDAASLAQLRERVAAAAVTRRGLSWRELARARQLCPLLDPTGRCSGYGARPLACRGCNSFSRAGCEAELAGAFHPAPAFDGATIALACGAHARLRAAGDGACYELVDALALELTTPGAPLDGCTLVADEAAASPTFKP